MPFPDLAGPLATTLAERGYAEPTAVQAAVLDPATAGRDLLVSAQTGQGMDEWLDWVLDTKA